LESLYLLCHSPLLLTEYHKLQSKRR
jgi:hypothetical protein